MNNARRWYSMDCSSRIGYCSLACIYLLIKYAPARVSSLLEHVWIMQLVLSQWMRFDSDRGYLTYF